MLEMLTGNNKRNKVADGLTGLVIGATIGVVAGLLLAPKPGKETIEDLKEKSKEVAENVKASFEEKVDDAKEMKEKVESEIKDKVEVIKEVKDEVVEDLKEDIEDTKEHLDYTTQNLKGASENVKQAWIDANKNK